MNWGKINLVTIVGAIVTLCAAFAPALPEKWRIALTTVATLLTHFFAAKSDPVKADAVPLGLDK
jgi:hypothetical protein